MSENQFINRELSEIEFNARVLAQALRTDLPLLERLQYLAIVTSNFDEFFRVRVAAIKQMEASEPESKDSSGLTPSEALRKISARSHKIFEQQHNCLMNDLLPAIKNKNLIYVPAEQFTQEQKNHVQETFRNEIFPLLTPLRTDTEPFPHIKNLTEYVAFKLKPITGIKTISPELKGSDNLPRIVFVEIPSGIAGIYLLPSRTRKQTCFTLLQDIITECGNQLCQGFMTEETLVFKVARDADFAVDEEAGSNFISAMQNVLIQRKSSLPVQMTCTASGKELRKYLQEKLNLEDKDVYEVPHILNPGDLMELRSLQGSEEISFEEWEHFYPVDLPKDEPYWEYLKLHDKVLHVPYESYEPVLKFISDAAEDPDVLAIKMTLYRSGNNSPIIQSLIKAAQNGKQVIALVELKARFDEEQNINFAQQLEESGVTVIYGLVNLKVHAKILMVIRREYDTIRRYVHLGTGNYNPKTSKLYSDLSLFTTNQQLANDATQFFNLVTGYSNLQSMTSMAMAPLNLKDKLISLIQREIDRTTADNPGLIMLKCNRLSDEAIISKLYEASKAGVKILMNIRGVCQLVPGVKGLSENITVTSIIDRYLEHSRIFYFHNGGIPELYCGSADLMSRNLDRRVELMFPILEKNAFAEVKEILDSYFKDNTNSYTLLSDGTWQPVPASKKDSYHAQEELHKKYKNLNEKKNKNSALEFIVRRK
ncbi:MAG: polyphosphate kinase 1 [Treponema sp.]|nr:polyphosphate kinase 1 [Treponema sp.]